MPPSKHVNGHSFTLDGYASLFGVHRSRIVARRCNPTDHACCCGMVPRLIGTCIMVIGLVLGLRLWVGFRVSGGVRIRVNPTLNKTLKLNPNLLSYWECCCNMVRRKMLLPGSCMDDRVINKLLVWDINDLILPPCAPEVLDGRCLIREVRPYRTSPFIVILTNINRLMINDCSRQR